MIYEWHRPIYESLMAGRDRRHHALLLTGPAGTGKSAFALELAQAILCERPGADGAACGHCDACRWFAEGNHPDFRFVTPAAQDPRAESGDDDGSESKKPARGARASREIRIDQIRALDGFLEVGAHRGGDRVIVIDPADAMNTITANALLKRLEEPPSRTGFILVANRPASLPATVRSRCQKVSLPLPARGPATAWLARETGMAPEQAARWLAASGGAPLHALRFADESEAAAHRRIVDAFAALPEAGIVATADALTGVEPSVWAAPAQSWAADLARVGAGAEPRRHGDRLERLRGLARRSSLERLTTLERRLRALSREAAHPLNPRLLLEDVLLDYYRALA